MTRLLAIAAVLAIAVRPTHAAPLTVDDHLARARAAFTANDLPTARTELQAAYNLDPRPDLLFALGQVELNLHEYAAAIDYYERFLATNPAADQATLAQQAIGAARIRLTDPQTPPPPPAATHTVTEVGHRWDPEDTALAGLAVAGLAGSALLVHHGLVLDKNHGGPLSAYAARQDRARTYQWAGVAAAGVGVVAGALALIHWRLEVDVLRIETVDGPATGVAFGGRW